MKIIVDAYGGDNAPLEIIRGCELAVKEFGIDILLVGKEKEIRKIAEDENISLKNISIENAKSVITMEDSATSIIKEKSDSSMAIGLKLLKDNKGDAFVSAGNSGALAVGATTIIKRIKGIKRPAFAPVMPSSKGCFMLIDSGANVSCRPEMLNQFGIMGSIYMNKVMKIKEPKVGLANIGTEEHKGTELQQQAYKLLEKSNINFIGNVEARDIAGDGADVIVADGFTGNIILKMYEGVAKELMKKVKRLFIKNLKTKIAASLVLNEVKTLKREMDYNEYGGAPIMGVLKPVFKAHGSAKANTIKNAIRLTISYIEGNVVKEIENSLNEIRENEL